MGELSKALGVGATIELGGNSYPVSAKILRHVAIIEAEIVKDRGNPFDLIRAACESLGESDKMLTGVLHQIMADAKNWNVVSYYEVSEFLETTWKGRAFTVWIAIKHNDIEGLTLSKVKEAFLDDYEVKLRSPLFKTEIVEGVETEILVKTGAEVAEEWWSSITDTIQHAEGCDELGNLTGSPTGERVSQSTKESLGT